MTKSCLVVDECEHVDRRLISDSDPVRAQEKRSKIITRPPPPTETREPQGSRCSFFSYLSTKDPLQMHQRAYSLRGAGGE